MTRRRVDVRRGQDGRVPREPELGETTTCAGCTGVVVRIIARGEHPPFGEPGYAHVGRRGCPGGR